MKFELTPEMETMLRTSIDENVYRKMVLNKHLYAFEIGDVLVKKHAVYNFDAPTKKKWATETISGTSKMSQRYLVVFKDELDFPYLVKIKAHNGKLDNEVIRVCDFDIEFFRFEVDPDYAEAELLGTTYDIKSMYKASNQLRDTCIKMNRKNGIKFSGLKQAHDFFSTLKAGDSFFYSDNYTGRHYTEYRILSMTSKHIDESKKQENNFWSTTKWDDFRYGISDEDLSKIADHDSYIELECECIALNGTVSHKVKLNTLSLVKKRYQIYYKQKPASEEHHAAN